MTSKRIELYMGMKSNDELHQYGPKLIEMYDAAAEVEDDIQEWIEGVMAAAHNGTSTEISDAISPVYRLILGPEGLSRIAPSSYFSMLYDNPDLPQEIREIAQSQAQWIKSYAEELDDIWRNTRRYSKGKRSDIMGFASQLQDSHKVYMENFQSFVEAIDALL